MKKTLALLLGMIFIFLLANLALKESAVYSAAAACNVVILLRLRTLLMVVDDNFQEIKLAASMYLQGVRLLLYTALTFLCVYLCSHNNLTAAIFVTVIYCGLEVLSLVKIYRRKKQQSFYNILKR